MTFDVCDAIDDDPYSNCGNLNWRRYYRGCEKYICPRPKKRLHLPTGCYADWDYDGQSERSNHFCGNAGWSCACWSTTPTWG